MSKAGRSLLFLATEDWFVLSHFTPIVERAVADGWRVAIAARQSTAFRRLEAIGARFVPMDIARSSFGARPLLIDVQKIQNVIDEVRPDLVHAIALKPATLATFTKGPPLILAVTGMGWLAMSRTLKNRIARLGARAALGSAIRSGRATGLFENRDDVEAIGGLPSSRVFIAPGAGVDENLLTPLPEPPAPPVRVGLVARMIRSKGVDLAVDAVGRLRRSGLNIELALAGAPDPDNPGAVDIAQLNAWGDLDGVQWRGRVQDIAGFWAEMHIACLPSRGGEGLPRCLLEAAAHARPIVTTDVPGCRDFVRDGIEGRVVPPNDTDALAVALHDLASAPGRRKQFSENARRRVETGYTVSHVQNVVAQAWDAALLDHQRPHGSA